MAGIINTLLKSCFVVTGQKNDLLQLNRRIYYDCGQGTILDLNQIGKKNIEKVSGRYYFLQNIINSAVCKAQNGVIFGLFRIY